MIERGLYLVTPDWENTEQLLAVSQAAMQGGAKVLQYRNKIAAAPLRRAQAQALRALTQKYGVALIINDDAVLALAVQADGVHIGREDGDIAELRQTIGPDFCIGASCYNDFERARRALEAGASYVAFGAMYASPTKPEAVSASPTLITRARQELGATVACIGGITADNAAPLVEAGADWVAVITDIYRAADPQAQALRFTQLYASHHTQ